MNVPSPAPRSPPDAPTPAPPGEGEAPSEFRSEERFTAPPVGDIRDVGPSSPTTATPIEKVGLLKVLKFDVPP